MKRGSVLPLLADGMIPENISSRMDKRMHLNRQLALRNRILNAAMLILHTFTRIPILRRYDAANARRAFLLSACLVPRSPAMDNEHCISPSPQITLSERMSEGMMVGDVRGVRGLWPHQKKKMPESTQPESRRVSNNN